MGGGMLSAHLCYILLHLLSFSECVQQLVIGSDTTEEQKMIIESIIQQFTQRTMLL